MSGFDLWLSPTTISALGWVLLHSLWQGVAIAASAALAMAWSRTASGRYLWAMGGLVLILVLPAATLVRIASSDAQSSPTAAIALASSPVGQISQGTGGAAPFLPPPLSRETLPGRFSAWLVFLWLVGVAAFSLRAAGGLWWLGRISRRDSKPVSSTVKEVCLSLQRRFGITRQVQYRSCSWLDAPAVLGWLRPIVFVPITTLTGLSESQLRLVIAHELAHIRRWDAAFNLLQIASEALFFFHPAVWWLNRRIRAERENCCDDLAMSLCHDPLDYARALTLMAQWRSAPSIAMAANGGPLAQRVARILGSSSSRRGHRGGAIAAGILGLSAALLAGHALAQTSESLDQPAKEISRRSEATLQKTSTTNSDPARAGAAGPWWGEGWEALPEEQRSALQVHGITDSDLQALRGEGLSPTFDQLVAMKIHGVTQDYARQLLDRAADTDEDTLIAMRVHGVDPDAVDGLLALGLELDADRIIALKIHGITPEWVRGFQDAGFEVDADALIGMKVIGVTLDGAAGAVQLGIRPDADALIGLRVHGISLDDLKSLKARGFPMQADRLIAMKSQGLLPFKE